MITIPLRLFIDRNDDKNIISSITKNQSTIFKMDLDMKLSRDYDTVIDDEKETIYQHLDEFNKELNIKIKSLEEKENEGFYDYKYISNDGAPKNEILNILNNYMSKVMRSVSSPKDDYYLDVNYLNIFNVKDEILSDTIMDRQQKRKRSWNTEVDNENMIKKTKPEIEIKSEINNNMDIEDDGLLNFSGGKNKPKKNKTRNKKKKQKKTKRKKLTHKNYKTILRFYKKSTKNKTRKQIKKEAHKILSKKLCSCIKKVKKTLKTTNESQPIAICTTSVINRKGIRRGKFSCNKTKKNKTKKNKTTKNKKTTRQTIKLYKTTKQ